MRNPHHRIQSNDETLSDSIEIEVTSNECDFCAGEDESHECWRCDRSYCDNCDADCERLDECGVALPVCPACAEAAR